jgi:uncharacterized membrane protein
MNWLMIVLRLVHIGSGAMWVGMMAFMTFYLTPALAEVGPDAGKVMQALQKRKIMIVMPVIALLTIISGMWLMMRLYAGPSDFAASRMGMALNVGALSAIVAFLIGVIFMRPLMEKAMAATDPAAAQKLRARGATLSRWVARLLMLALGAMAVARYL